VTVIRELNCYESTPTFLNQLRLRCRLTDSIPCREFMSVLLIFKHGYDDYAGDGIRIIGPVQRKTADAVITQLEKAFKSSNFDVVIETVADD
ncbi:MAG: hypothetical protein ACREE6_08895, partial [Limisphaerales bacterium]